MAKEYIEREVVLKAYLDLALAKSKAAKARKGAAVFQGDLFPMVELTEKEWVRLINAAPAADVVEVPKELRPAVRLLCKEYERAKKNPTVRNPIAYALYQTWKAVDDCENGR